MKIVVTASGPDLDSPMDPRFGRCQHFIFVDPDSLQFEAIENENVMVAGGAGIQSAQFIANKGAEALITGNVGPNALATLGAAGIKILLGATGTVREAVQMFKNGQLQEAFGPSGAGFGPGMSRGMGGGGRGLGMGRGMGMRKGIGMMGSPPPPPMPKKDEIQTLKDQGKALRNQVEEVKKRLKELKR